LHEYGDTVTVLVFVIFIRHFVESLDGSDRTDGRTDGKVRLVRVGSASGPSAHKFPPASVNRILVTQSLS